MLSTANTASFVDKVAVGDNPEAAQSSSAKLSFTRLSHVDMMIFFVLFCLIVMSHDICRSRRYQTSLWLQLKAVSGRGSTQVKMAVMPVLRQPCLLALLTANGKEGKFPHLKEHLVVLPNYRVPNSVLLIQ